MENNMFTNAMGFESNGQMTFTENGAVAHLSTGSLLVDQFGLAGNYRGRDIEKVFEDQRAIWDENPDMALRFPFYLRMVTRKTKVNSKNVTNKVQNGQGARDESFKRLLWIAKNHYGSFVKNIWLLPVIGSWKDIWTLMYYDVTLGVNAINHEDMFDIIKHGLACETHVDLVKKFMPRIKSSKKCTTDWTMTTNKLAKEFAKYVGITFAEYNLWKTTGTAHDFQKIICDRRYDEIKWNCIPGRALTLLTTGKFLGNHNLTDKYVEWVKEQPVAKFTGYVFELMKKVREAMGGMMVYEPIPSYYRRHIKQLPIAVKYTLDAQFAGLVEQAKSNGTISENVLVALDTSGSMNSDVAGLKGTTCGDIATSLALFFSELNTGAFHNKVIMFDNKSYPLDLKGDSFCDKVCQLPRVPCGGTNFQSVIDELVKIRVQHPEIPLEEYPTTILAVSDMQFNPSGRYSSRSRYEMTNHDAAIDKLRQVFPDEYVDNIKFIWWNCASREQTFEGESTDENMMFFSGFDGSALTTILGEEPDAEEPSKRLTPEEVVKKMLTQEILNYIVK
jgi:hypothetical protein